ncbi:Hsp20/alpha crystallin family protein [soil metagenome]|mgnify:CR=1 FL=1|jgi:HSP20 family protein
MTFVKVNNQPARNFDGLMKDIFNEIPASFGKTFREDVLGFPPVNITESAKAYQLEVAAPGLEKTDFTVKLDGTLLVISASKKEEKANEDVKSIRKEFSNKGFKRSFTLDEKIEAANIEAKYENGILKLTLPKKEETAPATKEITIQ